MKQTRVFNHNAEDISKAIGMDDDAFEQIKFMTFDSFKKADKPSQIAEYLHENASYDQILLMATMGVQSTMQEFGDFISKIKRL